MKNWRNIMSSWSFNEMRELQNRKLRNFIRTQVYPFSPFYRKMFDKEGIDVRSIKTVDDLRRLPFTSKADIAPSEEDPSRPREFILQPDEESLRKYSSKSTLIKMAWMKIAKGEAALKSRLEWEYAPVFNIFTTGRTADPTPFLFSLYDFNIWDLHGARTMQIIKEQIDYQVGQLFINAFPYAPHGGFWQVFRMTSLVGILTLQSGGGKIMGTARILDAVSKGRAVALIAVPGYLYHLLRIAAEEGRDLSSLRLLITGGERAHPEYREKVLQLARDCGAKDPFFIAAGGFTEQKHYPVECIGGVNVGYHAWPDLDFFEIVDPKSGERLPDDASGELVYTALDGRGSIVMRYRTGDLVDAPAISYNACPSCGLAVTRINSVISRSSEIKELNLTKIKGTLVNLNLLYSVIPTLPKVKEWHVELRKKNDDPFENDEIIVYITPEKGVNKKELSKMIESRMKEVMEIVPTKIVFEPLEHILERLSMENEMKELRVIDRRPS